MQERELDRLEQFISKLLKQFGEVREEKKRLETVLVQRDTEITSLKSELASADSARGDVSSRVKGLIEQIEEWEADLDEVEATSDETDSDIGLIEETEEEDKEGGLQQNLFNVEPVGEVQTGD